MHVIIHLLTARLPQIKEANYGYKYLQMWDFTHFWYLFCVILHIFHT